MIKVVDQVRIIGHDITHTHTYGTADGDDDRPTCGRTTTVALRPNNPTTSNHSHPRRFPSSFISHNQGRTDSMGALGQVSMGTSCPRAQSPPNRFNRTPEISNQLGGGSLPLEQVVSRESHLCWRVRVLRPLFVPGYLTLCLRTWNQLFAHQEQIVGRPQSFRTDRCPNNGRR